MRIEHPITYSDGDIEVGAAPILKAYAASMFPCRDEGKTDDEHQDEINELAEEIARLAEAARSAGL